MLFLTLALLIGSNATRGATNLMLHVSPVAVPPMLMPPSPIGYFRNLLAMTPGQRDAMLAKKSPEVRERILAKVNEYAALDPDQRELRLQATELRWYLMPLLRASPNDRDTLLTQVPQNIRDLVRSRLQQWELLPPSLQREFLDNERAISYFSGVAGTNNVPGEPVPNSVEQSRWNALSDNERQAMSTQFNGFFELSATEKEKAMGTLSDADQEQMQNAMRLFDALPPLQRSQCLRAFTKFANLTPLQRAQFIKNAQRWSGMSANDRKAWIDLVEHVPQWPPVSSPTMIMPPMPSNFHPVVSTNHG
jgi:hypothetical protein